MALVFIGLGTNLGRKMENLNEALKLLRSDTKIEIIKESSILKTEPVDYIDQPDFMNQIIKARTDYKPHDLLNALKNIEAVMGRDSTIPKGPRIIDLDILLYDNIIIDNDTLTIPHPEIKNRKFILDHLVELDPDIIDPVTKTKYRDF